MIVAKIPFLCGKVAVNQYHSSLVFQNLSSLIENPGELSFMCFAFLSKIVCDLEFCVVNLNVVCYACLLCHV